MTHHYELHEGVAGNGAPLWLVVAVDASGRWMHRHDFSSKAEAESWIKWA